MFRKFPCILRSFSTKTHQFYENVPEQNLNTKLLKVAVIGVPNVGKSTFINNLMDRRVCPMSCRVHTTRTKTRAIFTEGDSQIIFLDTPGLVSFKEWKKFNLEKSFLKDSKSSLQEADLIGVLHDASNIWTRDKLDMKLIRLLEENQNKPSFLVFNKVDLVKSKRKLLDIIGHVTNNCMEGKPIPGAKIVTEEGVKGWPHFQEIFMISALTGDGLDVVRNYLIRKAKPGQWMFPEEVWTDQKSEAVVVNSVKAKFLDFLAQELPYNLKPEMEYFQVDETGAIKSVVIVHCPNDRIAKLVAGDGDGRLRQITASLEKDLQDTFQNYVRIKLVLQAAKVDKK